jgi:hypothetical protein
MESKYRIRWRPIEIEKHPTFATGYIQAVEIVDVTTGLTLRRSRHSAKTASRPSARREKRPTPGSKRKKRVDAC